MDTIFDNFEGNVNFSVFKSTNEDPMTPVRRHYLSLVGLLEYVDIINGELTGRSLPEGITTKTVAGMVNHCIGDLVTRSVVITEGPVPVPEGKVRIQCEAFSNCTVEMTSDGEIPEDHIFDIEEDAEQVLTFTATHIPDDYDFEWYLNDSGEFTNTNPIEMTVADFADLIADNNTNDFTLYGCALDPDADLYEVYTGPNDPSLGSVSCSPFNPTFMYENGATVTLTATPTPGNYFAGWVTNDSIVSTGTSYSVTVDGDDIEVVALFLGSTTANNEIRYTKTGDNDVEFNAVDPNGNDLEYIDTIQIGEKYINMYNGSIAYVGSAGSGNPVSIEFPTTATTFSGWNTPESCEFMEMLSPVMMTLNLDMFQNKPALQFLKLNCDTITYSSGCSHLDHDVWVSVPEGLVETFEGIFNDSKFHVTSDYRTYTYDNYTIPEFPSNDNDDDLGE